MTLFDYAAADVGNDEKLVDILFIFFGRGHFKTIKHDRTFCKFLLWPPTARELSAPAEMICYGISQPPRIDAVGAFYSQCVA